MKEKKKGLFAIIHTAIADTNVVVDSIVAPNKEQLFEVASVIARQHRGQIVQIIIENKNIDLKDYYKYMDSQVIKQKELPC